MKQARRRLSATWVDRIGFQAQGRNQGEIIKRLSMDSVQNHKNTRIGSTDTAHNHSHGMLPEGGLQGFVAQQNMHVVSLPTLSLASTGIAAKSTSARAARSFGFERRSRHHGRQDALAARIRDWHGWWSYGMEGYG
jgi:hypothetical protein